jgi:GNAT superfamily N-acetyltransferase
VKYHVREATLTDADVLVRQRMGMFTDMGEPDESVRVCGPQFLEWLRHAMPAGLYRAWLLETESGEAIAGGGITVIPWPPGPRYRGGRLAFVYNVYTEPEQRHRGHARAIMDVIHGWCREQGISALALNASDFGRPLYEAMGYRVTPTPMMFIGLE